MEIAKTNRINALFEFYEPLLTKKQMEYLLRMWAEKGEDYTVGFIRYVFLKGEGPGIGRNGRKTRRPCLK